MWWLVGDSNDRPYIQPVLAVIAVGMSMAVIIMVGCDVEEIRASKEDLRAALKTMERMRQTNVNHIRHTPAGGTRRVTVPDDNSEHLNEVAEMFAQVQREHAEAWTRQEADIKAGRTQSSGQSADVKAKLDVFNLRFHAPEVYPCGFRPQRS